MGYAHKEHTSSMTIFYYKRTGVIYSWVTGIQDFRFFGEHEQEYGSILDRLVMDKDSFFISNSNLFKIDVDTKKLILDNKKFNNYGGK